jgi:hypothetical protein
MKIFGGVSVNLRVVFTLAPPGGEWSATRQGRFNPGEKSRDTNRIRGWVGYRSGLDFMKAKIPDAIKTRTTTYRSSSP